MRIRFRRLRLVIELGTKTINLDGSVTKTWGIFFDLGEKMIRNVSCGYGMCKLCPFTEPAGILSDIASIIKYKAVLRDGFICCHEGYDIIFTAFEFLGD